jgi:hypothetical protein
VRKRLQEPAASRPKRSADRIPKAISSFEKNSVLGRGKKSDPSLVGVGDSFSVFLAGGANATEVVLAETEQGRGILLLMDGLRSVVIAMGLAVVQLAGCTTTQTRTAMAAQRLERSAETFVAGTCYEPNAGCSTNRYLPAARAFADEAKRFDQTLQGAGDQEVVLAFKRLWGSYHTLHAEVHSLHDRQAWAELEPVTRRFVDVQLHVKNGYSSADPTLYASGGYMFDPYYN